MNMQLLLIFLKTILLLNFNKNYDIIFIESEEPQTGIFTMNDYNAPRDDLFEKACLNGDIISASVIQYYVKNHKIAEVEYAPFTEINLERQEIDKYYIAEIACDFFFRFWTAVSFQKEETSNSQKPELVRLTTNKIYDWEVNDNVADK